MARRGRYGNEALARSPGVRGSFELGSERAEVVREGVADGGC
jgi:hypothetical protein